MLDLEGRSAAHLEYRLFTDVEVILPGYNASVRRMFRRILDRHGIVVHTGSPVVAVAPHQLATADGRRSEAEVIL